MKERTKYIIAIIAVISIIVVVIGATYAYWQWSTNSNEEVNVIFNTGNSVPITAYINGNGTTTVSNLLPAACTNQTYALQKEVVLTYENLTPQPAIVKATLTVSNWNQPHSGTLSLNKLHYALTTGTAASGGCNAGTNRTLVTGGSNTSFVTSGALINDVQILSVPANTARTSKTYYLWVWLDSSYEGTNSGSAVTDPMQDLTFTLTWSGTMSN